MKMWRDNESPHMDFRQQFLWVWQQSTGYRSRIMLVVIYGLLSVFLGLTVVWLTRYIIDYASSMSDSYEYTPVYTSPLLLFCAILAGAFLARLLFTALSARLATYSEISLRNRLRVALFSHLTHTDYLTLTNLHTGDIIGRLDTDLPVVTVAMAETIPNIIIAAFSLIGSLVYLFIISPALCLLLLFISPLFLALSRRRIRTLNDSIGSIRRTATGINTYIQDVLRNFLVIKSYQAEHRCTSSLEELQDQLKGEIIAKERMTTGSSAIVKLSFSTAYMLAFIWGVYGLAKGEISFGTLAAFLQLAGMIQRPLRRLGGSINGLAKVGVAIGRIRSLEVLPLEKACRQYGNDGPRQVEKSKSENITTGQQYNSARWLGVRMEKIVYNYPYATIPVLYNFSADFPPHSITAVMGETGTGKSTLLKLISSILTPVSGVIYLYTDNNITYKDSEANTGLRSPQSLRDKICYVPQGKSLLPGSIRSNLLIGNPYASEDEINNSLRAAVADEFVNKLPYGLDTVIGDSITLSEGQAQRIAIARSLLRPGGILLLDEPTSSLDTSVEAVLINRLKKYVVNRTIIIVTHRDEVAQQCDRVITLKKMDTGSRTES